MSDVVAVVTDLFFQSRILAAARMARRDVRLMATEQSMSELDSFKLALVDLDAHADILRWIEVLKLNASGPVIAFGPHLDTGRRKSARAAGADRVLAKSKFVTELPKLLLPATLTRRDEMRDDHVDE